MLLCGARQRGAGEGGGEGNVAREIRTFDYLRVVSGGIRIFEGTCRPHADCADGKINVADRAKSLTVFNSREFNGLIVHEGKLLMINDLSFFFCYRITNMADTEMSRVANGKLLYFLLFITPVDIFYVCDKLHVRFKSVLSMIKMSLK